MVPGAEPHDACQERIILLVVEFLLACAAKSGAPRCSKCAVLWRRRHPVIPDGYVVPAVLRNLELQITKRCRQDLAVWDAGIPPPPEDCVRRAPRCTGLCGACQKELDDKKDDPLLKGVVRFSARNHQDPLDGFPATDPVTLLNIELHELFRQATVLEAMLVSLNHMQVSVCTFTSRADAPHRTVSLPQECHLLTATCE